MPANSSRASSPVSTPNRLQLQPATASSFPCPPAPPPLGRPLQSGRPRTPQLPKEGLPPGRRIANEAPGEQMPALAVILADRHVTAGPDGGHRHLAQAGWRKELRLVGGATDEVLGEGTSIRATVWCGHAEPCAARDSFPIQAYPSRSLPAIGQRALRGWADRLRHIYRMRRGPPFCDRTHPPSVGWLFEMAAPTSDLQRQELRFAAKMALVGALAGVALWLLT